MKKLAKLSVSMSVAAAAFIILDQLVKYFAAANFRIPYALIKDFFEFRYAENTGIAFGIPLPSVLMMILTALVLVFTAYFAVKELNMKSALARFAVILILAGGLGNMIDRVFRGYVIDFIGIWKYPNFNIADIYITVGVLLIIVFYGKIKKV
ncbi:MAG: signal peptidase II [Candidatus Peregrinibacteria bacterium]